MPPKKKGKKKALKSEDDEVDNVSSYESVDKEKSGDGMEEDSIKQQLEVERLKRTKGKGKKKKGEKKSSSAAQDFELKNIGSEAEGGKDGSTAGLLGAGITESKLDESVEGQDLLEITKNDVTMLKEEESKIDQSGAGADMIAKVKGDIKIDDGNVSNEKLINESKVTLKTGKDSPSPETPIESLTESNKGSPCPEMSHEIPKKISGEQTDSISPETPDVENDVVKKSSKTEENVIDGEQKLADVEKASVVGEVFEASVEMEVKHSIEIKTTFENQSQAVQEDNLVPSGEVKPEKRDDHIGQTGGADKTGEPPSEKPSRRSFVPDGEERSIPGDEAGGFNRPLSNSDESSGEVPIRRRAVANDSDQLNPDDPGSFSPPIKTKDKTKLDANENPVIDHNVLAGRTADDDDDEMPWAMYRDVKKEERKIEDEDDEFSADDENIGNDFKKGENLPELYEYLGSLDNGDTELESKGIPPSLFGNEQQKHMHQSIDQMKLALAEEEIGGYLEEFEKQVEEEVLMIGSIGLEEVQDEERSIRERHIEYQQNEARIQRDKQQELSIAMDRAKKHVMKIFREKHGKIRDKEMALMKRDHRLQGQISKAFKRSENQLLKALRKRKAEVQAMYGDLVFADRQYGGSRGRRWKVDWNKTSQPIQIKIKCLRSVRDKLPIGQYVLMVSLYSRVGGHVMKWSNLKGQKWGAATMPLIHDGEFYNTEMKIDQSVFTVCPSKPDMRPGMVLMFELFILSGPVTPTAKIVGWGCFPICDGNFNVVDGKYKTPLLRGSIDPSVDKFQAIEERIASDLEYWLCNLYFEIVKLPRYLAGQKEYEVEMQFSSGLVSYPVRTKTGEEFVDGEQPVYGSVTDMSSIAASRTSMQPPSKAPSMLNIGDEGSEFVMGQSNIKLTVEPPKRKISRPSSAVSSSIKLQKASEISTELRQRRTSHTSVNLQPSDEIPQRKSSITGSRRSIDEKSLGYSDETDTGSGTDYNDDDVCIIKKDYGFRHVKGQPGMYYKVHQNNPADIYARKLYKKMPQTAQTFTKRKKKKISHLDELKQHTYNVKSLWSNKGQVPRKGREKMQYIGRMMLAELGLSQWRNSQFWITLFMLLVTWFIRMYLHYFGQWVLLKALSIPINKFNFYAHTVNLNYQDTLLQARHEMGIVIMGPFTNFLFFLLFVPLTYCFQRYFKWFPDIVTQFMLAFGIQAFLDPLWILIVDCAIGRYKNIGGSEPIGDAFKLYWHFFRNYNNEDVTFYVSISLTAFLYVVIAFSTCALWYMFFIGLHNNGRLMDVYWRLHGSEEEFFMPYDLEVGNDELNYICMKAEQWRGEDGERRKVAVYDYVWEQEELGEEYWDDPSSHGRKTGTKEITTHLSIHTISPDGLIELYRHFLRLPDGAIIEVFGELNMPGIDEGVKQALMKKTGFQGTSNVVRRSRSLSVSSMASSTPYSPKTPARRMSSNRLDVPV